MWNDTLIECARNSTITELDLEDFGLGRYPLSTTFERQLLVSALLGRAKYLPSLARAEFVKTIQTARVSCVTSAGLVLTSAQVRELHAAGMEIGAHTMNLPILTSLGIEECSLEIQGGRDILERIIDAPWTYSHTQREAAARLRPPACRAGEGTRVHCSGEHGVRLRIADGRRIPVAPIHALGTGALDLAARLSA
jgi:hypothetical protein